jgi:hypothetical protein
VWLLQSLAELLNTRRLQINLTEMILENFFLSLGKPPHGPTVGVRLPNN